MKRLLFLSFLLGMQSLLWAQSVSAIKSSPNYLWGEGKGKSLRAADQAALAQLISQISVTISEDGQMKVTNDGADLQSVISTYSSATLNNTQRMVVSDEPDAHVLRYIRKADLDAIWKSRIDKVREFCRIAHEARAERNIGDALRYYYWANALLQSIPNPNDVSVEDERQQYQKAVTWLPKRINELLQGVSVKMLDDRNNPANIKSLSFFYEGKPVSNIDFTYFDGQDWSPVTSAHDGMGQAEMRPGYAPEAIKVKIEYLYLADALSDKEVNSVLDATAEVGFPKCAKEVSARAKQPAAQEQKALTDLQQKVSTSHISQGQAAFEQLEGCQQVMLKVIDAIRSKNYSAIQQHCTPEGYKAFDRLIHYGNARIIGEPELHFKEFNGAIYCRSLTLNFKFSRDRSFIEDVVFVFTPEGKLDNIQFGLGKVATADVLDKPTAHMSEEAKVVLVNFLESYKTAYAMNDIDYLERVFSDDALIITGKVLRKTSVENPYGNNQRVVLTQQSKADYMKALRRVFASNEFVNLKFANNVILKSKVGEIYAIQIRQDYYSTNYGDSGYLFLLVDVSDPNNPVIHVRAWQEVPDSEWGLIDLSSF
ncbi:MAG: LPP20 family lipoprotein [Bacteroidales bacterium]|nr:LPP20 family lipoprotein [Bacteroidales bacterium]